MTPSVLHLQRDVDLDAYLSVRDALGFQMRAERTVLRDFVRFLETHGEAGPIRAQRAVDWACASSAQAAGPPGSLRPHTLSTFIGVLASTGLRVGEAIRLTMPDVRLETSPPV